jgi:hypothetical protein
MPMLSMLLNATPFLSHCKATRVHCPLCCALLCRRNAAPNKSRPSKAVAFHRSPRAEVPLQAVAVQSYLCLRYALLPLPIRCSARLFHCISKHGQPVPWLSVLCQCKASLCVATAKHFLCLYNALLYPAIPWRRLAMFRFAFQCHRLAHLAMPTLTIAHPLLARAQHLFSLPQQRNP